MTQQHVLRVVYSETRKAEFDVPRSSGLLKPLTSIRPVATRTLVVPCHWEKTKVFAEKVHEIWSLQVRPNPKAIPVVFMISRTSRTLSFL